MLIHHLLLNLPPASLCQESTSNIIVRIFQKLFLCPVWKSDNLCPVSNSGTSLYFSIIKWKFPIPLESSFHAMVVIHHFNYPGPLTPCSCPSLSDLIFLKLWANQGIVDYWEAQLASAAKKIDKLTKPEVVGTWGFRIDYFNGRIMSLRMLLTFCFQPQAI